MGTRGRAPRGAGDTLTSQGRIELGAPRAETTAGTGTERGQEHGPCHGDTPGGVTVQGTGTLGPAPPPCAPRTAAVPFPTRSSRSLEILCWLLTSCALCLGAGGRLPSQPRGSAYLQDLSPGSPGGLAARGAIPGVCGGVLRGGSVCLSGCWGGLSGPTCPPAPHVCLRRADPKYCAPRQPPHGYFCSGGEGNACSSNRGGAARPLGTAGLARAAGSGRARAGRPGTGSPGRLVPSASRRAGEGR